MILDILKYILLIIGAFVGYKAKFLYKIINGSEPNEKQFVIIKSIGLLFVLLSMILIIYGN